MRVFRWPNRGARYSRAYTQFVAQVGNLARAETRESAEEPGLQAFLQDPSLSGTATAAEVEFLRTLRFRNKRPTALYYYRELQSLRDPLHFHTAQTVGAEASGCKAVLNFWGLRSNERRVAKVGA